MLIHEKFAQIPPVLKMNHIALILQNDTRLIHHSFILLIRILLHIKIHSMLVLLFHPILRRHIPFQSRSDIEPDKIFPQFTYNGIPLFEFK